MISADGTGTGNTRSMVYLSKSKETTPEFKLVYARDYFIGFRQVFKSYRLEFVEVMLTELQFASASVTSRGALLHAEGPAFSKSALPRSARHSWDRRQPLHLIRSATAANATTATRIFPFNSNYLH